MIFIACAGLFAGKPAPTGTASTLRSVPILWERVYPRRGRACFQKSHSNR
ncbi:hypothetical protein RK21_00881 [Pseudomonas plecoglossicida]|nr:hypothetical protein RK21_00881 [Pseudomonas plecoglossicida]